MTVRELMKALIDYPMDAEVYAETETIDGDKKDWHTWKIAMCNRFYIEIKCEENE